MGNILEFAIALQTSEFLASIGVSEKAIVGLTVSAEALHHVFEKLSTVMEMGAVLQGLANATGESVGMVYALRRGLEAVGSSGDNLGTMLLFMQRSMSGFNETGQRTDLIFRQLGLNMMQLRGEDTAVAMQQVAEALSKIPQAQRAGIAEALFGRGGAEQILQIANDAQDFQEAMQKAAQTAELWQEFSKVFKSVVTDVHDISDDMLGVWVQVGGWLAPELHKVFSEIDQGVRAFGEAIKEGKIGEILELSLMTGIELAYSFMENLFLAPQLWKGIGDMFAGGFIIGLAAVENAFVNLAALGETLFDEMAQHFSKNFGEKIGNIAIALGIALSKIDPADSAMLINAGAAIQKNAGGNKSAADLFQQNYGNLDKSLGAFGPGGLTKTGTALMETGVIDIAHAMEEALKNTHSPDMERLVKALETLAQKFQIPESKQDEKKDLSGYPDGHYKMDFTWFEKIGMISKGVHIMNPFALRQVDLLQQINEGIHALHSPEHTSPIMSNHGNKI
jgi:hypothetical protein